jgi:hypothetical protein
LNSFGGDGRVVRLHQIEEVAPDVRHARRLLNRSPLVELVETGERVGLQDAFKLGQMLLRVFALAVRRLCKPYRRRSLIAGRPVVAYVSPEPAGLGFARSRRKHRQRRVIVSS